MYVCRDCKSLDIEVQMWVSMNTLQINGDVLEGENDCWCNNCGRMTSYEEAPNAEDPHQERPV